MRVGVLVRVEASVSLLDIVDVSGLEILRCELLEDGAVVGERVDGLESGLLPEPSSQRCEADGVGQVIEPDTLPVEITGEGPVAARWS